MLKDVVAETVKGRYSIDAENIHKESKSLDFTARVYGDREGSGGS